MSNELKDFLCKTGKIEAFLCDTITIYTYSKDLSSDQVSVPFTVRTTWARQMVFKLFHITLEEFLTSYTWYESSILFEHLDEMAKL